MSYQKSYEAVRLFKPTSPEDVPSGEHYVIIYFQSGKSDYWVTVDKEEWSARVLASVKRAEPIVYFRVDKLSKVVTKTYIE